MELPEKRKKPLVDMNRYVFLLYGSPKVGKTTTFASWPDIVFLSTEPGTKGMEIFEIEIHNWKDMREAVLALEKSKKKFRTVCIDTVAKAYDMCLDWVCEKRGIEYPGESNRGKQDFGKSWKAVRSEFVDIITRIINTGRGLCLTAHSEVREHQSWMGSRWDKITPVMGKQAKETIEALVDIWFYMDKVTDKDGKVHRIFYCEGDDSMWAGSRKTVGRFPAVLPSPDPENDERTAYEIILQGFNGEHPGIDAKLFKAARESAGPAGRYLLGLAGEEVEKKHEVISKIQKKKKVITKKKKK